MCKYLGLFLLLTWRPPLHRTLQYASSVLQREREREKEKEGRGLKSRLDLGSTLEPLGQLTRGITTPRDRHRRYPLGLLRAQDRPNQFHKPVLGGLRMLLLPRWINLFVETMRLTSPE